MEDPAAGDLPVEELSDAIAQLGRDGVLSACNARCRRLFGGDRVALADLLPDAAVRQRLDAGDRLPLATEDGVVEMRIVSAGARRFWLASPPSWPEAAAAERLRSARAAVLGRLSGGIVHDLGNLLLAGVGLAETLRPLVQDPADLEVLEQLSLGARRGSVLGRTLAQLLARSPRRLQPASLAALFEDAVAVIGKSALRRGVKLTKDAGGSARVRVVAEEVVQAIVQGAVFCMESGVTALALSTGVEVAAVGGGRDRRAGFVLLRAEGLQQDARERAVAAFAFGPGVLRMLTGVGADAGVLLQTAMAVHCVGGEVRAGVAGGVLELRYVWPALRA
ncbi:MAG: hypothetical protein U1E73_03210 [Planctomycetota bacterium]